MVSAMAASGDCGESTSGSAPTIASALAAGTDSPLDLDDDDDDARLERATQAVSALATVSQHVVDACAGSSQQPLQPPWNLLPVGQDELRGRGKSRGSNQRGRMPRDLKKALQFAGVS